MIVLKIAWREIMRQRSRTWLNIAAIAFCSVSILMTMAFAHGSHQQFIQGSVSTFTGHFQLQKKGYLQNPGLTKGFALPVGLVNLLENDRRVQGTAPRVMSQGLAASDRGTAGVMIVGADPALEAKATTLAKKVRKGDFLLPGQPQGVVLGKTLADNLKVSIGDEVQVMASSFYGSLQLRFYQVIGLIKTGSPDYDRNLLIMPLAELQSFLEMNNMVTEIAVVLKTPRTRDAVMAEVNRAYLERDKKSKLIMVTWEKIVPEVADLVLMDNAGGVLYLAILVIVVAFVVLLTITMSVLERMREFGVLLAIGARPRRIFQLVMAESFIMAVLGISIGLLIASIPSYYWSVHPIELSSYAAAFEQFGMEPVLRTILIPAMFWGTAAIMFVITLAMSLFPAVRASRIKPVDALRYV